MNTVIPIKIVLILFITILLASCKKNSTNSPEFEDGILIEISEKINPEILGIIENELDMPIHRGDNPPVVDATFVMNPYALHRTNVPSDAGRREPGHRYAPLHLRLSGQNSENYTINFDTVHSTIGEAPAFGPGSFIIGNGNRFSIFGFQQQQFDGVTTTLLSILSGILEEDGISSPHHTLFMIDNGEVSGRIPNNTGRSFVHGNNKAPFTSWPGQQKQILQNTQEERSTPRLSGSSEIP